MIRVSSGCFGFLFRHRGVFGVVRLRVVRSAGNDVSSNTNPTRSRLQHPPPNLRTTTTLLYSAPTKQGPCSLPIHSRPLRSLPSILAVAPLPTPSAPNNAASSFSSFPNSGHFPHLLHTTPKSMEACGCLMLKENGSPNDGEEYNAMAFDARCASA
ncbi:hypothetical protein BLNAU_3104 [Blattamonas nauphoetae]|uniref:Uncharacterized protein n=1 Tax=Blattamonas nauphoetae TaxID=2049346 RepID=A0ABQ9YEE1_9EUKA|nr:hypothetical protein BLNAU_3104 [Blattamonas nauphoetae]